MNRAQRRAASSGKPLHALRVRVGTHSREDGKHTAVVVLTLGEHENEYTSKPYDTLAEAEAHRVRVSAGVREHLSRKHGAPVDLGALGLVALTKGGDA